MTTPAGRRVTWRYTFHDLLTREPLARLPLVDADLSEVIGGPASGTGKVPVVDPDVRAVDPWTATTPRRTLCLAQRIVTVDHRIISAPAMWAGIVWKRVRSGRHLTLTMATPESYWKLRHVAADRTFAQVDDAAIQRQIVADAEAVPAGSIGVLYGSATIGTLSDRTVAAVDLKTVLDTVTSVASGGGGFDWRLAPGIDADGRYTLTLQQAARMGRADPAERTWTSRPDGRPGNELIGYELTEDGTGVVNRMTGLGSGEGEAQLRSVQTATEPGFPLLEASVALSSTGDLLTQTALDRHTTAALDAARDPEVRVTAMTVRGDRGPSVDTYGLGDAVAVQLNDPLHAVPYRHAGRIIGRRIVPPQPGRTETVAMTLGPT